MSRKDQSMPEKPSKVLSALYGGLIMGAISGLPVISIVNCFCCAGILLGGFLSVMFYKNELMVSMPPLTSSDCVQLGALAGLFGAVFGTILHVVTLLAIGDVSGGIVLDMLRNMDLPPEILDQIEERMGESSQLAGFSTVISFVTSLVIDPLFGLLGGLIGYSVYKPKPQMMNVQPPPLPPTQQ
jgi:hypothetical protein